VDEHTPGPWKWFGNLSTQEVYLATARHGRKFVMQFERWGMRGAQPSFQVRNGAGDGTMKPCKELAVREVPYRGDIVEIDHPDARLIAAAPILLDALKFALRESGCDGELCAHEWHEKARAAIAEAEASHG
jgi:hypothetical protein